VRQHPSIDVRRSTWSNQPISALLRLGPERVHGVPMLVELLLHLTPPRHVLFEGPACRRAPLVVLVALLLEDDLATDPSGIIRAA
jgi:hypothetical protein